MCIDVAPAGAYTERRTSPSNTNHRERTRKVSTAPTAVPSYSINACKSPHSYADDKWAVLSRAVGIHPMAVANSCQYRPQESPANRRINESAGDAVGTLRRLLKT